MEKLTCKGLYLNLLGDTEALTITDVQEFVYNWVKSFQISWVTCPEKINPLLSCYLNRFILCSLQNLATFRNTSIFKYYKVEIPSQELTLSPYQLTPQKLRTELGIGKVLMSLIKKQGYKGLGEGKWHRLNLLFNFSQAISDHVTQQFL